MNLPNSITISRIFCVPVLIWCLSSHRFGGHSGQRELLAAAVFMVAAITDLLDGYLARKRIQVSSMGILLDPLADKLLISGVLIALVQFNPRIVPAWVAVLVIGREFLVTGLRNIAAVEGFTIAASDLGKLKMVLQIVAVTAAILDHRWRQWSIYGFIIDVELIARLAIWFMVIVALISAADYFVAFWSKIDKSVIRHRRRRTRKVAPAGVSPHFPRAS